MRQEEDGDYNSPKVTKTKKQRSESPISVTPISKRSPRIIPEISVTSPRKRITRSSCSPSEKKHIVDAAENIQCRRKFQLQRRKSKKYEEEKDGYESAQKRTPNADLLTESVEEMHKQPSTAMENNEEIVKVDEEKAKPKVSKPTTSTYRSGLRQMIELFRELNGYKLLTEEHANKMRKTPFAALYAMFKDGALSVLDVRKHANVIQHIMKAYSKEDDSFIITGKRVQLKVEDMAVMFGLPVSGKLKNTSKHPSEFAKRHWSGMTVISNQQITNSIREVAMRKDDVDVEDLCKMVILLMISIMFQCGNGSGVNLETIALIDDFNKIKDIG